MAFAPTELTVSKITMTALTSAHREISPYAFNQVAYDFQGDVWKATIDLSPPKTATAAAVVEGWLLGLGGPMTAFQLYDVGYLGPFGLVEADGTLAVGVLDRAKTIVVQHGALAGGGFGSLVVGDRITLGQSLHRVTTAAAVDGVGVQSVTVFPRLRSGMALADPVVIFNPFGTWALVDPSLSWAQNLSSGRSQTLKLIEAL